MTDKETTRIDNLDAEPGVLVVQWGDGHTSRFHHVWLRDNCRCEHCGNRAVGQKLTRLVDLPCDVVPIDQSVDESGALVVTFGPDEHIVRHAASWLREHCYSETARAARAHQPKLWNQGLESHLPETTFETCFADDAGQHQLLTLIRDYGFALVHGVPANRDDFERMARHVGFLRETNYGRIGDLVTTEVVRTLSNTKHPIPLHTDEGYRHANPGMLAFLCLSCSEDGEGATLLADGFQIAERLRTESSQHFELLTRIPIAARRFHADEMDLRSASPVISVDFEGRIQGVRYNERSAAPLDLPADLIEPTYAALRAWLALSSDPDLQVHILLQPGDFVVLDNQRVLQGRERFAGNRHLLYCQLDLDEPHSRARVLGARLGLPPAGLTMHRGT